jgi:hypothetical protein
VGGFRQRGRTERVVVADFNNDVRSMSSWRPTPAWTVHNLSNLPEEFYGNGPPHRLQYLKCPVDSGHEPSVLKRHLRRRITKRS